MVIDIHHHAIITSLNPLFDRAIEEGLWFYYHAPDGEDIWCSPEYLRSEQAKGRLILSPEHWELRNPAAWPAYSERVIRCQRALTSASIISASIATNSLYLLNKFLLSH